jgi:hypothetical protein
MGRGRVGRKKSVEKGKGGKKRKWKKRGRKGKEKAEEKIRTGERKDKGP